MAAKKFVTIVNKRYLYIRKQVKPINLLIVMEATKKNFRVRVMKYAWHLWRTTGQAWRICMIKAWQLYKLAKAMRSGVVTFWYSKADGTLRKANGTLRNFPAGASLNGKKLTKPSYKTLAYFDTDKNAFRCFKVENLIAVC